MRPSYRPSRLSRGVWDSLIGDAVPVAVVLILGEDAVARRGELVVCCIESTCACTSRQIYKRLIGVSAKVGRFFAR